MTIRVITIYENNDSAIHEFMTDRDAKEFAEERAHQLGTEYSKDREGDYVVVE